MDKTICVNAANKKPVWDGCLTSTADTASPWRFNLSRPSCHSKQPWGGSIWRRVPPSEPAWSQRRAALVDRDSPIMIRYPRPKLASTPLPTINQQVSWTLSMCFSWTLRNLQRPVNRSRETLKFKTIQNCFALAVFTAVTSSGASNWSHVDTTDGVSYTPQWGVGHNHLGRIQSDCHYGGKQLLLPNRRSQIYQRSTSLTRSRIISTAVGDVETPQNETFFNLQWTYLFTMYGLAFCGLRRNSPARYSVQWKMGTRCNMETTMIISNRKWQKSCANPFFSSIKWIQMELLTPTSNSSPRSRGTHGIIWNSPYISEHLLVMTPVSDGLVMLWPWKCPSSRGGLWKLRSHAWQAHHLHIEK